MDFLRELLARLVSRRDFFRYSFFTSAMAAQKKTAVAKLSLISNVNGTVTLSTEGTKPAPGAKIIEWALHWGDGTFTRGDKAPELFQFYKYPTAGQYHPDLLIFDSKGNMDRGFLTSSIFVNPPTPLPSDPPGGGGGAITVDADVDQTILLPATEVALFGNASKAGVTSPHAFMYTWSQVSGPATATFNAPWDRHTTVEVPVAGTYVFMLTAFHGSDTGSDTVTVTAVSESVPTKFYVDPSYIGGNNDGSAARPWTTLATGSPLDSKWVTINAALASNHVIIFFSARQAASDTQESLAGEVNIWRSAENTNILMLDGQSKYNTNESSGSWSDYAGAHKFKLTGGAGCSIGVQSDQVDYPMDYTRLRGFECTGTGGRVCLIGSHFTIEDFYVHNLGAPGANVQYQRACNADASVHFGNKDHITFRRIQVEGPSLAGEGIYIAGTYTKPDVDGHPSYGNNHNKILIESCDINMDGTQIPGGEGDAIDLKAGLLDVTIRFNNIENASASSIETLGVFWPTGRGTNRIGNYLIENNRCVNGGGISLQKMDGCIVRNNICEAVNIGTSGEDFDSGASYQTTTDYWTNYDVRVYNNTMDGAAIVFFYADIVDARNNAMVDSTGPDNSSIKGNSTATNVTEDYNATDKGAQQVTSGGNSITLTSPYTGVFTDRAGGDYSLGSSSACKDVGDSSISNYVPVDYDGTARTAPHDIGAFNKT